MYLYKLRTTLANLVADHAAAAALKYAGDSGSLLVIADVAISYIDHGEYTEARRVLLEAINNYGSNLAEHLDHYNECQYCHRSMSDGESHLHGGQPNPGTTLDDVWYDEHEDVKGLNPRD